MPKELTKKTDATTKTDLDKIINKNELKWRTPWHEKEAKHFSLLRTMYTEESNLPTINFLSAPINFSPSAIKKWWEKRREERVIAFQQYLPERNEILGNELAAAHFIVYRRGAIKFFGEDRWIKADEEGNYSLPRHYQDNKVLQAIDCTDVELHYEGLVNFRDLKQVEWFSINGCVHMDDWCIDRIANLFSHSLLYLDLRNCPKITYRGLGALQKLQKLKILYLDSLMVTEAIELTCLMLQEINPDLEIRTGDV